MLLELLGLLHYVRLSSQRSLRVNIRGQQWQLYLNDSYNGVVSARFVESLRQVI